MLIKKGKLRFFKSIRNPIKRISLEWMFVFALIFLEPFSFTIWFVFTLGRKFERKLYSQTKSYRPKGILTTNTAKRNEQESVVQEFNF
jgi:hypothetical protein